MARPFGETIRGMREAQGLGLREMAERIGMSPAYLSRIERGREHPPRPELIKKIATILGGDPDLLFRLAESTDPDLAEFMHLVPSAAKFLRLAKDLGLTGDDFELLTQEVKRRSSSTIEVKGK